MSHFEALWWVFRGEVVGADGIEGARVRSNGAGEIEEQRRACISLGGVFGGSYFNLLASSRQSF